MSGALYEYGSIISLQATGYIIVHKECKYGVSNAPLS
jgi:hypothetical protein